MLRTRACFMQSQPGWVTMMLAQEGGATVEISFPADALENFCEDGIRCARSAREAEEAMRRG
jgi:hypothetical protein